MALSYRGRRRGPPSALPGDAFDDDLFVARMRDEVQLLGRDRLDPLRRLDRVDLSFSWRVMAFLAGRALAPAALDLIAIDREQLEMLPLRHQQTAPEARRRIDVQARAGPAVVPFTDDGVVADVFCWRTRMLPQPSFPRRAVGAPRPGIAVPFRRRAGTSGSSSSTAHQAVALLDRALVCFTLRSRASETRSPPAALTRAAGARRSRRANEAVELALTQIAPA